MKKQQLFSLMFLFFFCTNILAQKKENKPLQISPYGGIALPQGDIKDFTQNGSVFGVDATYQFSKIFGLVGDFNLTSLKFNDDFKIDGLPSNYLQDYNINSDWKRTNFLIGPVYKFPTKRTNLSLYALGGISSIKIPEVEGNVTGGFLMQHENFKIDEQKSTGFGFSSGLKLGFNISDNIGFYINPRYSYSSAKSIISCKTTEFSYILNSAQVLEFSDEMYAQEPFTEKEVNFSTFDITAGLTFNLGDGKPKDDIPDNSVSPSICDVQLDTIICENGRIFIKLKSTWLGQNANSIANINVNVGGNNLPFTVTTPNLQPLGSTYGNGQHTVSLGTNYIGSSFKAKLTIDGPNGIVDCTTPFIEFDIPPCPNGSTCDLDINASNISYGMSSTSFDLNSLYNGISPGSTIDIAVSNGLGPVPVSFSPNNLPLSISGSGNIPHTITIPNNNGNTFVVVATIRDANGDILCSSTIDLEIPLNEDPVCEIIEIEGSCRNGQPYMEFSVDWTNYTNFGNYSIYLDAVDQSGNPVAWFNPAFPPFQLTGPSGSKSFSMNLMPQYAGQTLTIRSKICETLSVGIKHCCPSVIKIDIPECCEDCDGISITDNTNPNQKGEGFFRSLWTISNITTSPVNKISLVLESFGADNSTSTQVLPRPNFEIQGAGVLTPTINQNARPIGSLNGKESNFWIIDFQPNPFLGGDLAIIIGKYDRKILKNYRIRATLYKTDGTRCVKYLSF